MKLQSSQIPGRPARLRQIAVVAAMMLSAHAAWAVEPFTVRDIKVEGLQRVEPGTLFASLPVRIGDTYNDEKGAASIRALYALGLFNDIRIDVSGDVLVVIVQERPSIADVSFSGLKEFDKDAIAKAMREVGLAEGRPYDKALTDRAEQEIKRQYINRSLYGAEVETTVTPLERNRVNLAFAVTEGAPSRIRDIRIVGNKAFAESTLKGLMSQDTGSWLSWYTKSDRYSRAKFSSDLETLRSYYTSRGYLDFKIESTQVAVSDDKRDIDITINVTEGDKFIVSGVTLEGNYLERDDEFKSLVKVKPGQPYNSEQVADTTKAFTDHFANFGYAFARVVAQPQIDRSRNTVALSFAADSSRRAYVRKIHIGGNNRTRDEVIRREFRQFESSWYDGDRIKLSKERLERLGFFTDVQVEAQEIPDSPDQVDLVVAVTEKPTGSIQLGASYSSAEKLGFIFGIKQENAFGSGNYLGLEVNTSKYNRTLAISTIDPYFTQDGLSRAFDVYHRTTRPYNAQNGDYRLVTQGAGVRFGVPFSEVDMVSFGLAAERIKIVSGSNLPTSYQDYANQFGYASTAFPLTVAWARDTRDSALVPNAGRLMRVAAEAGLFGDARYVKADSQFQQYIALNRQYTLAFNADLGWAKGIGNRPFPLFKNFYAGGLGSVRAYEQGSLGPRDASDAAIGGQKKINLSTQLFVPFPGAGNDRTLRLYGFADLGNVWGENDPVRIKDMRAAAGIGVSWISPMGPLSISFAAPLRKQTGDKIQRVQFQLGASF